MQWNFLVCTKRQHLNSIYEKEFLFESFDGLGRGSCLVRPSAHSEVFTKATNAKRWWWWNFLSSSIRFPHFKLRRSQISPEMCWNCRQTVFMSHHLHFLLKLPFILETLNEDCCTFKRKIKKIWWKHPKDLWLTDDHMLWLLEFQTELKKMVKSSYTELSIFKTWYWHAK